LRKGKRALKETMAKDGSFVIQSAVNTLLTEAEALTQAASRIDVDFERAVDRILSIEGKLIVTGIGKSGLVGAKIAATLASTGTSSFFLHPSEALHGDLGMIDSRDGVLAISYSGESEELSNILPHIRRFDVPLLAMTADPDSTLAGYAEVVLDISVEKEACPLGVAPTSSTTLTMAMGDALAVALMRKRGFKKEDFASFHPGGSLGRRLFVKISDIMRRENLPIVHRDTPLKRAVISLSEGRLGNILIVDDEKRLVAVMSDGDLRRALLKEDFDMERAVMEYATKEPKILEEPSTLASDALALIEEMQIQILPVLNSDGTVEGVVHIHDLVSAGIKSDLKERE
jgi:arabinose-5-phosphate isomerase